MLLCAKCSVPGSYQGSRYFYELETKLLVCPMNNPYCRMSSFGSKLLVSPCTSPVMVSYVYNPLYGVQTRAHTPKAKGLGFGVSGWFGVVQELDGLG